MHFFIQRDSKWRGTRNGKVTTLQVVGIWATGVKDEYRAVSYELQEDDQEIKILSRETMEDLITKKILIRTY